ncbi:MAG TPA: magnesium transporter, partial [Actinomycetota bacterium]|nr:magnesium transporter [Actinomycetota bacterium]
ARLARRARRLLGYWRSERRTLRQGIVALALSTCAGFVAGLVLGSITGTLEKLPGLLVLIPAAVGMRGTIFGAMGARLGTGVAAGLFEPTLRRGSLLSNNVVVGILSALLTSFYLAALAKLVAAAFGEEAVISFWDLVTISVIGGVLASSITLVVTIGIAVLSFRRGWDLDAVSTPMVTAIGDMVTLPALFLASLLVANDTVSGVTAVICTAATVAALLAAFRAGAAVRRILLEMLAVVALAPLLDIVAGALLQAHDGELRAVPAVLILIPPFISQAGALGGILSSRLSSKLQLGVITSRGRPEIPALVDGAIVVVLGVAVFTTIGAVSWALSRLTAGPDPGAAALIGATMLAGAIVLPITLVVGYYLAVLTSRFGVDPDNQGVPFITSLLDLAGVAAILLVMRTSGVLP